MNSPADWQRVRRLFHDAIQRPDAARAAYLDEQCGEDDALRREVESLLAAHVRAEGFLDRRPELLEQREMRSVPLAPGVRFRSFEISAPLGAGGMGEVYQARDTRLGRDVAIKLLPPDLAADPDRRARFERESRVLAALSHPHVAAIYGIEDIDGRLALVLELIEGPTLADRLASGPLQRGEALRIALVHRDLKPANVKMTLDGVVKLLDFGLAKAAPPGDDAEGTNGAPGIEPRTHEGLILGTGAYMSPEQARGQQVDKRTDIWAFGCLLYEMLSGRRAFPGETIADTIAAVLDREPDWTAVPAAIAPDVHALLRRCLQKDPRRRLHDIADARVVIEDALQSMEAPAARSGQRIPWRRRRIAGVAAILAIAAAVWSLAAWRRPGAFSDVRSGPSLTYLTLAFPEGVGLHSAPALSPDGSTIAFVGIDRQQPRLYVRRLSSPEVNAIHGTEGARQPFWSPDGRWLAFFAGNKLKKVAVDGGAPVDICSAGDARGGSWGNAGIIVFTPHLIDTPVYRVSADGGTPQPVTRLDDSRGDNSHRWPAFLPDGVHFLYFIRSSEDGRRGVYLARIDRPAEVPVERVIESEAEAHYVPFGSDGAGAIITAVADGVRIQRFDAVTRRLMGHPQVLDIRVGGSTAQERAMLAASHGTLAIARQSIDRSNRLVSAARDGSDVRAWPELAPHNWPRLSPDGTRLAFQRVDALRGTADLWVKDLVRRTETRVTTPPAQGLLPAWSPDGERVAMLWGRLTSATIAIGAADGTQTTPSRACPVTRCDPTDWSPDGRTLIVTAQTANGSDVWTLPVEPAAHTQARPLIAEPSSQRDARVSPDGEWLAYVSDESGREEVFVRRMSGRNRTVVSPGGGSQPVWRRDATELFFVDRQGFLHAVPMTRGAGGALVPGQPRRLDVPPIGAGHWGTQYDVSPDGGRVYYIDRAQPDPSTSIEIIFGWTDLLR
jgi:Tol biopolymer transport system component